MAGTLPVVCIFGMKNVELKSLGPVPFFETDKLDCRCYLTDDGLDGILVKDNPSVIVAFGKEEDFPNLLAAPFDVRKQCICFPDVKDLKSVGDSAFFCYVNNALVHRIETPLVTVFTPTFKTGDKIRRSFRSLQAQTYSDWEWILFDDSDDDGETFKMLQKLAEEDYRVKPFRGHKHSGVIGHVKRCACHLGNGEYLVELDHDDELTPFALEKVVAAYQKYPECGFVYTDFAECFEDGSRVEYPQGWGFGYGNYRHEVHGGQRFSVNNGPNINPKTIRHIIAAPNHIRSWRKSTYLEIGGHSDIIHVADDYEIMVRTFLHTRMARVPYMCYVQYRNFDTGNTHKVRNQEIHRLVRYFSCWYDQQIHERFLELGIDDFVWKDGEMSFYRLNYIDNPREEPHCTILAEV